MGAGARGAGGKSDLSATEATQRTITAGLADTRRAQTVSSRSAHSGRDKPNAHSADEALRIADQVGHAHKQLQFPLRSPIGAELCNTRIPTLQRPMPRGTKNSLPRGTRSLPNINRVVNRAHRLRIWANSSGKGLSRVQRVTKRRERRRRGTASGTRRNGSRDRETESSFGQSDP